MTEPRIFAQMVARNEADRYLDAVLTWLDDKVGVNRIHVYDDRSEDATVDVALWHGCAVTVRPEGAASFLEHEGRFRADAWAALEEKLRPHIGDWILAIDADEFLVGDGCIPEQLEAVIAEANRRGALSVLLPVPEVFAVVEQNGELRVPQVRIDGLWGTIAGTRLFAYQPGGEFNMKAMGCGSEPTYVVSSGISRSHNGLALMHYGYADPADVPKKYERYSSLAHGHADKHVASIPAPPSLCPWDGLAPSVWRGVSSEMGANRVL